MTTSELRSALQDLLEEHATCESRTGGREEGCSIWEDLEEILEDYDGK